MTTALTNLRRLAGILGPALGIVWLCSLVAVGVHHHAGSAQGHACAVCTASHAPAVTTVAAARPSAPAPLRERVASPLAQQPPQIRPVAVATRGPPTA